MAGQADYDPVEEESWGDECRDPAQQAWLMMRAVTHPPALLEESANLAAEMGISHSAVRALRQLAGAGTLPMSRLAAHLNVDSSYVTGLVDTLEKAGLAERQVDTHDRRVKVVALTPKGKKVAKRARAMLIVPPPGFAALDPDEIETLAGLLRKLRDADPAPPRSLPEDVAT